MSAIAKLSTGCIKFIMTGEDSDKPEKPVLQVIGTKKIAGGADGSERYRMLVSDGQYLCSFAMLATQLNDLYTEGKLEDFTVIQVDRYMTSMVNKTQKGDRRVLVILELTVLNPGSQVGHKIGNPVQYDSPQVTVNNNTAKPPPVAPSNNRAAPANSYGANNSNSLMNQSQSSFSASLTHPIASLSPYQNKWVIKARVTMKSPIRTWSNAKGEGKLFSMDLMDESGEIRATAFREAVDRYYDMIEVDKVYFISKCQLKPANKQFTTLKNDYEMSFTPETVVQPCEDDESGIPKMQYQLVPIAQIATIEPKAAVDIIGVCHNPGTVETFTGKTNNREFKKREIVLVDSSNVSVNLTLWGDDAVNFDGHVNPVVLCKGGRVTEFGGGKSVTVGMGSCLKINPDIPEGHKLRGWYDNGGYERIETSISTRSGGSGGSYNTDWLTFYEARAKNLGAEDKADYFQTKAVIHIVKSSNPPFYKACPQADCNKKIIDENNGEFRCEKCNRTFPNFKYRLLVNMSVADWNTNRWVTCFSELAEQILGKSAQEAGEIMDGNQSATDELLSTMHFKSYIFKLRTKSEMYGDMNRTKNTVISASPINYKEYNKYLINNLQALTGVGKVQN